MKWLWLPLFLLSVSLPLSLGSEKVIVVANSIDYSPELIEYLQIGYTVASITPSDFPNYQGYQYYVVLGGPDAPEGTGEIVRTLLGPEEQRMVRTPGEYNLFVHVQGGKTFCILAGSDREKTRLAATTLKDKIPKYIKQNPIKWIENFDEALEKAKSEDKLVYIDFYTTWCKYCIQMDKETYTDPRIVQLLSEKFTPVRLNREKPENAEVVKKYGIHVQPMEVVLNPDGDMLWSFRGYVSADQLYLYLTSLLVQNPSLSWQSPHNFIYI